MDKLEQKMDERLQVIFAGVKMRSPVGISAIISPLGKRTALTPELHAAVLLKHVEAGAGFVYVPFFYMTPELLKELQARAILRPGKPFRARRGIQIEGMEGMYHSVAPFLYSPEGSIETFPKIAEMIDILRRKLPENVAIIANIMPMGDFHEDAVAAAKKAEELGVDLIELNTSCAETPSISGAIEYYLNKEFPLLYCGVLVGEHPDIVERIAKEVSRAVDIPVGVKLTPEMGLLRTVGHARRLRDAGVKYVESFNYGVAIVPPDIYNRGKSRWPYVDGNPFAAASGGWLRIPLYKHVAGIAKFAAGIDIAAGGGLMTPEHTVEVMMLGAKVTQFATAMLLQGRDILRRTIEFLLQFMDEQGYNKVEDLVGLGIPHIKPLDEVDMNPDVVAEVDPDKCQGSGRCVDIICLALERNGGKARVKAEFCNGCGICVMTCPNSAIRLKLR